MTEKNPPDLADQDGEAHVFVNRSLRVPLESYVKVVKDGRVARAMASDISISGVFLSAMALPTVGAGDLVRIEVALPGGFGPIHAEGQVVRDGTVVGFHAIAIRFTDLPTSALEAIQRFVEARRDHGH